MAFFIFEGDDPLYNLGEVERIENGDTQDGNVFPGIKFDAFGLVDAKGEFEFANESTTRAETRGWPADIKRGCKGIEEPVFVPAASMSQRRMPPYTG